MSDREPVSRLELESRVMYSLLTPAVKLAFRLRIPVDRITEMVTLAYLAEMRRNGLTLKESAVALGKSHRTVNSIARKLREGFLTPDREAGLPRRIEFLVAAQPHSRDELLEALRTGLHGNATLDPEHVSQAIDMLLAEGRIRPLADDPARYEPTSFYANLVRETLTRRMDGLNHLLEAVLDTVMARFFDEDERAFARVLTFGAARDGAANLRQEVYDTLRLSTLDLEESAAAQGISGERYSLVFTMTPVGDSPK